MHKADGIHCLYSAHVPRPIYLDMCGMRESKEMYTYALDLLSLPATTFTKLVGD